MLQTTQVAIIFDCKVAESGYAYLEPGSKLKRNKFLRPRLSLEKSKHITTNRNFLVQRVERQIPRVKSFTYEAVKDFIEIYSRHGRDRRNFPAGIARACGSH